jgi:hypothetical protein
MSDANDAVDYIYTNAPLYAQAKANRVYLEEFRKSKKALLMNESDATAATAREQYAYSHPDYQALITGLKAAVEVEETLKWRMEAAKIRTELWRTESANNRTIDRATQ